jgi:hypothetical protein
MKKYVFRIEKYKPVLLFIILLTCSKSIFSQRDFKEGYIITNENDTVYGWIDRMGDLMSAVECVFRKQKSDKFTLLRSRCGSHAKPPQHQSGMLLLSIL